MSLVIVEDNINYGGDAFGYVFRGYIPTQGCPACICWRNTQEDDTMLGPIQQYSETFSLVIDFDPNNLPVAGEYITINKNTYTFVEGTPSTNLEVDVTGGLASITNQLIAYWQKDPTIYNYFIVGILGVDLFLQTQNYGSKYIPTYESGSENIVMYPQLTPEDRQGVDLVIRPDYFVEVSAVVNNDEDNPIVRVINPIIRKGINTSYHVPNNLSYIHYAELCYDFTTLFKDLVYSTPPESSDPLAVYEYGKTAVVDIILREKQADGQTSNSVEDESLNSSYLPLSNIHIIHAVCEEDEDTDAPLDMSSYLGINYGIDSEPIKFLNVGKTSEVLDLCPNSLQYIYISVPSFFEPQVTITSSLGTSTIVLPDTSSWEKASEVVRVKWSDPTTFNYPLGEDIEIAVKFNGFLNNISETFYARFSPKYECCCLQEFLFLSKRGAYETLQASCVFEDAFKVEADEYFPCYSCLSDQLELQIYRPIYDKAETLRSIPRANTPDNRKFIESFVSSSEIYKITYDDVGNFIKERVYLTVFPDLYANHKNQIQFQFSYTYASTFTGIRNL